jgi:hypothetical protein
MKSKIGIGLITCNRVNLFKKLLNSIPEVDNIVVVNDGNPYENNIYSSKISEVIQHKRNKGVGKTKNDALKYLLSHECKHIFLLEDDIAIADQSIFEKYIKAGEVSGILHFNYAYHGVSENRTPDGQPNPRKIINYDEEVKLAFYYSTTAALTYYRDTVLKEVGLIDTVYRNAIEHVDHTYQIYKKGFHPPFRWFADLNDSHKFIQELDLLQKESLLKKNKHLLYLRAKIFGAYFRLKNGYRPFNVPDATETEFLNSLDEIKLKFAINNR